MYIYLNLYYILLSIIFQTIYFVSFSGWCSFIFCYSLSLLLTSISSFQYTYTYLYNSQIDRNSSPSVITFEVFDWNKFREDKRMGKALLHMVDLIGITTQDSNSANSNNSSTNSA